MQILSWEDSLSFMSQISCSWNYFSVFSMADCSASTLAESNDVADFNTVFEYW